MGVFRIRGNSRPARLEGAAGPGGNSKAGAAQALLYQRAPKKKGRRDSASPCDTGAAQHDTPPAISRQGNRNIESADMGELGMNSIYGILFHF